MLAVVHQISVCPFEFTSSDLFDVVVSMYQKRHIGG